MSYWIKINYERGVYLIDLESISAFSSELENKRITFWLPNNSQPVILSPHGNADAYRQVLEFIKKTSDRASNGWWIFINYDRKELCIDLNRISAFSWEANGRLTFCLPDSMANIVITPQNNLDAYEKIQNYIEKMTGHSFP